MTCPRCGTGALQESVREGITVDGCPACRGLWLDRGELERLIARAADEWEDAVRPVRWDERAGAPPYGPSRPRAHDDDYDDDDWYRRREATPHPRRKRWFDILKDVID